MNTYIKSSLLISVFTAFSLGTLGCGDGGGDSASVPAASFNTGYYLDSAVAGVSYSCGDKKGITDGEGIFYFANNVNCTFSYTGIILRETNATDLKPNVKIYEDNVYVGRFLQSMDQDGISGNGLQIPKEVEEVLSESGKTSIPTSDAEIDDLIAQVKLKTPLFRGQRVSLVDAKAHMDSTVSLNEDEYTSDELELSLDAYLLTLNNRIVSSGVFGWKTTTETNRLRTSLDTLDSKISVAETELANVDIDPEYQAQIDALLSNKVKLATLVDTLEQKNIQLDTAIRVGSSVSDVNIIIEEIKALTRGDVYKYFDELANYGRIPLPTIIIDNPDQMQINTYLNQAGASALAFVNDLESIYVRMNVVSKAYTQTIQSQIKQAYDTTSDTNPDSCSVANYTNSVVLEPQLIGQCQLAFFYDCSIKKYGPTYPTKVPEMENRIVTVCSILDGYQEFTLDATNPKDTCNYCDGVNLDANTSQDTNDSTTTPDASSNTCYYVGGGYEYKLKYSENEEYTFSAPDYLKIGSSSGDATINALTLYETDIGTTCSQACTEYWAFSIYEIDLDPVLDCASQYDYSAHTINEATEKFYNHSSSHEYNNIQTVYSDL